GTVQWPLARPARRARLGGERPASRARRRTAHSKTHLKEMPMGWKWPWAERPKDAAARLEMRGAQAAPGVVALHVHGEAIWTRGDYSALAREGFMRNPVVHRSVQMIAQA